MLLTAYRQRLQSLLTALPAIRRPFLRRSLRPDALLTTDLPRAAEPQTVEACVAVLLHWGWQVRREEGLLEITPELMPPERCGPISAGEDRPALRRLHSLLVRHPGGMAAAEDILAFLKAEEAGKQILERCCEAWCARCAAALREHTPLPGELLPWVQAALTKEEEE